MNEELIVTTPQGKLYGTKSKTVFFNSPCYSFCGIPYAKPPLQALKFMPPEPAGRWQGLLDATEEKSDCIHYSHFYKIIVGSEDCLYLNVHTPEPPCKITKPKSVIALIHPGGNSWGSGSRHSLGNPDFIVSHDVIVVGINYRLHALGFLNLGIPQCSGNMGLKDQVMALKWIQNNIKCFGGDPNNVTLCGSSTGACDIHFHMMSPLSKGLFHKVIMQCGYALNSNWSYISFEESYRRAVLLAEQLGYQGNNARKLYTFFRSVDAKKITEAVGKVNQRMKKENPEKYEGMVFISSIEIIEKDAFLNKPPRELIYKIEPMPVLSSIAEKEGLAAFCAKPLEACNKNFEKVIREALWMYKLDDEAWRYVTQQVRSYYYEDKDINEKLINNVINMYTDLWYRDWYDWIDYMAAQPCAQPVYLYQFKFCGNFNYQRIGFAQNAPDTLTGASHADDTSYFTYYSIMNHLKSSDTIVGQREGKVVHNLSTMLTNFAKTGNPNGGTISEVHWKPHHPNNPSYLQIDEDLKVMNEKINEKRFEFWHNLMKYVIENEMKFLQNK